MSSAITAGDINLARTLAIEINSKDAKEPMALMLLGEKAFNQGRHKQAQGYFTALTPDLTMGIAMGLMEGWSYVAVDDMDKARETFKSVGGGSYFDNLAELQIAKAEALKGNVDAAKAAFKAAEENGQSAIETRLSKARFLHSIGENDTALKELEAFSEQNVAYERTKQWDKAEADFKRVLEIEPDNADALNYLGYTWVDRGENLTEAFEMIRRALELEPGSGAITDSLGWARRCLLEARPFPRSGISMGTRARI